MRIARTSQNLISQKKSLQLPTYGKLRRFSQYCIFMAPKQKQSLKAVEELLAKIELDAKRARLLLEQLQE